MYKRLQEYNTSLQQYNSKLQTDLATANESQKRVEKEKLAIVENLSTLRGHYNSLQEQLTSSRVSALFILCWIWAVYHLGFVLLLLIFSLLLSLYYYISTNNVDLNLLHLFPFLHLFLVAVMYIGRMLEKLVCVSYSLE